MKKKFSGIILLHLLILVPTTTVFAHGNDGKSVLDGDTLYYTNKTRHFSMTIEHKSNSSEYIITLKAKAKGWIAVGFGRTVIMKDAEMILGYIKNGECVYSHDFGVSQIKHVPISTLDPILQTPMLTLISAEEKDGVTTIVFSRPSTLKGKYYKEFARGKKMEFMYALSAQDDGVSKHAERGAIDIVLP